MKGINYVGSTHDIKERCRQHNVFCWNKNLKNYNLLVYQYIREKEMKIELEILGVYKRKCSKKLKFLVEQFYINEYDSVNNGLNSKNAFGIDKKKVKEYQKIYHKKNKKKLCKYHQEWYEENKEQFNQKRKVKINCCLCGSLICKGNLKRHQKTKRCKSLSKVY